MDKMARDSGTLVKNILEQLSYHDKSICDIEYVEHERCWSSARMSTSGVTVGRVSTARLLGMCGNHG
jgi:hypothetical protein